WEAAAVAHFPQFAPRADNFGVSFYRWLLYFSPYSRIFEFIGGCLTCQLFLLARLEPAWRERLRPALLGPLAIVVMTGLWGAFFYNGIHNPWLSVGTRSFGAFLVGLHMDFLLAPSC